MARASRSKPSISEAALQEQIVYYLRTVLPPPAAATVIHIVNEGKRSLRMGAALKRQGMTAGVEDIQMIHHGRHHGIEIKTATGRQTPEQKAREAAVVIAGGRYAVCRSVDDVRETLRQWAIPTRERL